MGQKRHTSSEISCDCTPEASLNTTNDFRCSARARFAAGDSLGRVQAAFMWDGLTLRMSNYPGLDQDKKRGARSSGEVSSSVGICCELVSLSFTVSLNLRECCGIRRMSSGVSL